MTVAAEPRDEKMAPSLREEDVSGDGKPTTTLREDVAAVGLDKVYERHGRIDLIPLVRCSEEEPRKAWASADYRLLVLSIAPFAFSLSFDLRLRLPTALR